jgi:outer membrane protein OmpA-like peptidoglycan-associated protein
MSPHIVAMAVGALLLVLPPVFVSSWMSSANDRLVVAEAAAANEPVQVAVAAEANEQYCTPELKQILRRVLQSCGLIQASGGRGCEPVDAKHVATMSGADFNALFLPMKERGGIVQYDQSSADLDAQDLALIDKVFADRKGASYFFVVSRASPEGTEAANREISRGRADAVLAHLKQTFNDPDLDRQVGLLWLGEEFAQLDPSFCAWQRSGGEAQCLPEELNRSAFITWIDCTL